MSEWKHSDDSKRRLICILIQMMIVKIYEQKEENHLKRLISKWLLFSSEKQ